MSSSLLARMGETVVQHLAALLAWAYPRRFRREAGHEFTHIAAHRYGRELASSGSAGLAIGRTTLVLCADTIHAAPAMWRSTMFGQDSLPMGKRIMQWLSQGSDDFRLAMRTFLKQPVFALLVVGTLGLGIGASASALSSLDRAVLRPFGFADGDRFAFVSMLNTEQGWRMVPSAEMVERWRASARSVEAFEIYQESTATYLGDGVPEIVPAANISAGLPALLGLRPVIGRVMGSTDVTDGAAPVIMISEAFWRSKFGASRNVLSQTIQFGSLPYSVIGVWPQAARVHPKEQADVFFVRRDQDLLDPSSWSYVVAKLAPGVTHADADADLAAQMGGLPDGGDGRRPSVTSSSEFLGEAYVRGLWLVFGASLLLMLVGVANASNLLLARAASRTRELGVRLALGGTPWRLVRMFVAEGAVLSTAGAVLAVGVAWALGKLLSAFSVGNIPAVHFGGLDPVVFVFAAGGAAFSTLVCGVVPVVHGRTADVRRLGGSDGDLRVIGAASRVRQALVSLQAAIGVILIAGAILMSRSLMNLTTSEVGFALHELVTMSISPPESRYPSPEARQALLARIADELKAIPGVTGVTTSGMPLFRRSAQGGLPYLDGETPPLTVEGETTRAGAVHGYFDVMGIALRQGRIFHQGEQGNVVVVNESFARRHGGNVIGRRLYQPRPGVPHDQLKPSEIVGVVADVTTGTVAMEEPAPTQVYIPARGTLNQFARFMIRTNADPDLVLAAARQRVAAIDPLLPPRNAETGTGVFFAETAQHRLVAVLLGGLALLGVILAVGGVYGAVTIEVRRRTREVGLRVALGATAAQVVRLIVRTAMRPVMIGAVVGVMTWVWAATLLSALLFRIEASDATSTVAGVAMLALIAGVACVVPARRASRVDPAITLRVE